MGAEFRPPPLWQTRGVSSGAELLAIVTLARDCASKSVRAALAQLVSVEGSHYRRPGARMLLAEDGRSAGAISAGCLEADLRRRVPGVLENGRNELVEYDARSFEDLVWGLGTGCNGCVRVLLSPLTESLRETLGRAETILSAGAAVRLAIVVAAPPGSSRGADDVRLVPSGEVVEAEKGEVVFVDEILPPISLLIAGCGPDAVPLARIAGELGWIVTIMTSRDPSFVAERFAGLAVRHARSVADIPPGHSRSAAVVMSHNFSEDAAALDGLLPRGFPYLAVLGPRERTRRLLAACASPAAPGIRSPAGLDLGSETAAEIALSIASEIQGALSFRDGKP